MNSIHVFTDGACSGNPGPGGWGALIFKDKKPTEIWGHAQNTTNNRMEMIAAIQSLETLLAFSAVPIHIHSDSQYLVKGVTLWSEQWKKNGWLTSQKKPVENQDLWKDLLFLKERFSDLSWSWVKGHSGHVENTAADTLANWALEQGQSILNPKNICSLSPFER